MQSTELPDLTGSEKQIAWAMSIRGKAITAVMDGLKDNFSNRALMTCLVCCMPIKWYSASFWINHRDGVPPRKLRASAIILEWFEAKIQARTIAYPKKVWQESNEEYAHEGEGGEWLWFCEGLDYNVIKGEGDLFTEPIFCTNPENGEREIWHYQINIF